MTNLSMFLPKPEVRSLSLMHRWIDLGHITFHPKPFRSITSGFLHYRSKTVDSVEIFYRIKNIKTPISVTEYGALTRWW